MQNETIATAGGIISTVITAIVAPIIRDKWNEKKSKKKKIIWLNHNVCLFLKENTENIRAYEDLNIKDEGKRKLIKDLGANFLASTERNLIPFITRIDTGEITLDHASEYCTQQAIWTGTLIDFYDKFKNRCRICKMPEEVTDKVLTAFSSKTGIAFNFLSDILRFSCDNDTLDNEGKISECLNIWLAFLQSLKNNLFETANGINGSLYGIIYDGVIIKEGKSEEEIKQEELARLRDKFREVDNINMAMLRDSVFELNKELDELKKELSINNTVWKDDQE